MSFRPRSKFENFEETQAVSQMWQDRPPAQTVQALSSEASGLTAARRNLATKMLAWTWICITRPWSGFRR